METLIGGPSGAPERADGMRRRRGPTAVWVAAGLIVLGSVLRVWGLGRVQLDFDECFEAMASRLSRPAMVRFLRAYDSHPPLDYLLRHPLAVAGATAGWFRLPSAMLSILTMVVAWRWWKPLGRLGLVSLGLLAVSPFAITYARDARPYAGLGLVGVTVAFASTRWLEESDLRRWGSVGAIALLGGLFFNVGALLVVPGMVAVAGLRRDRAAWAWRGCALGPLAIWAATWGPSFVEQARGRHSTWIQYTSWHYATVVLNELINDAPALRLLTLGLAATGALLLPRGALRRVWWSVGALPIGLAIMAGTRLHLLLPRTLAFAAWAPILALAAAIEAGFRRQAATGLAVGALCALLVLPSTVHDLVPAPTAEQASLLHLRAVTAPGDAVTTEPSFLQPMVSWYLGVQWSPHGTTLALPGLDRAGLVVGAGPWTGRTWVLVSDSYADPDPGWPPCAPPWTSGTFHVLCLRGPGS